MDPQTLDVPEANQARLNRVMPMFYALAFSELALGILFKSLEWAEDAAATGEIRDALHWLRGMIGAYMIVLLVNGIVQMHRRDARMGDMFGGRGVATAMVAILGLLVGKGYMHGCLDGSKWTEAAAMLGTPLVAGSLVFDFYPNRRAIGFLLAAIVIATVWILCQPYLDWVHGNL